MNLIDRLDQAGYETIALHEEYPPCALLQNGKPIGFLNDDLSVTTLTQQKQLEENLNSLIAFSVENDAREHLDSGELVLSKFEQYTLATDYDYKNNRPVYLVYRGDGEQQKLVASTPSKEKASTYYVNQSGLAKIPKHYERERALIDMPGIFHSLKNVAQQIGLKLRVCFGFGQTEYRMQKNQTTVASVDSKLNVTYPKQTDQSMRDNIDAAIQKVRDDYAYQFSKHPEKEISHTTEQKVSPDVLQEFTDEISGKHYLNRQELDEAFDFNESDLQYELEQDAAKIDNKDSIDINHAEEIDYQTADIEL